MTTNTEQQSHIEDYKHEDQSYDELPYDSLPHLKTHPERIAVLGKILGYDIPELKTARVLEIGCAGGMNILPLALDFPEAEFTGIDLSPVQVAQADDVKERLGLKNITFEALDLMEMNANTHGKFDYIYAQGVFSWVPDFVRDKILDICTAQLTPNGMAVMSYNTMPGWGTLRTIREMLLIHTETFTSPEEKVEKAIDFIEFLKQSQPQGSSLKKSIDYVHEKLTTSNNKSYVYHEYLEANNTPYYFKDYHNLITEHGLKYIGDTNFVQMYPKNLKPEVENALKGIQDPVLKEQYMDFVKNRQFRYSVVTHKNNTPKPLNLNVFKELYYTSKIKTVGSRQPDNNGDLEITSPGIDGTTKVQSPLLQSIVLGTEGKAKRFSFEDFVNSIQEYTKVEDRREIEETLLGQMMDLVFLSFSEIVPHIHPARYVDEVSEKPKAYELARIYAQDAKKDYVINAGYDLTRLKDYQMLILKNCDGKNTVDEIFDLTLRELQNNKALYEQYPDPSLATDVLEKELQRVLEIFRAERILIS